MENEKRQKPTFILYVDYYDMVEVLTDEMAGKLFKAIFRHELGMDDGLEDVGLKAIFAGIQKLLDQNREAWERRCEINAVVGKLGGRPRKSKNPEKPNGFLKNPGKPTETHGNLDNDNENDNNMENSYTPLYPPTGGNDVKKPKSVATDPPTREEVEAYKAEKGYHFDVEEYMAHYESNGWRVGQNPMKKWKAACVTWEKSWKKREAELEAKAKRYEKPSEIGRIHVDMDPDKYREGAW